MCSSVLHFPVAMGWEGGMVPLLLSPFPPFLLTRREFISRVGLDSSLHLPALFGWGEGGLKRKRLLKMKRVVGGSKRCEIGVILATVGMRSALPARIRVLRE